MIAQLKLSDLRDSPGRVVARLFAYSLVEGRPPTTRGQWINPVARIFQDTVAPVYRRRGPVPVVSIAGVGRSGTTILGRWLGALPGVLFLNEPKLLWSRAYAGDDLWGGYSPGAEPDPFYEGAPDDWVHSVRSSYSMAAALTRSRLVVDKYPEVLLRANRILSEMPEHRMIWLLRHPYDVASSVEGWNRARATEKAGWWGIDDRKWDALWRHRNRLEEANSLPEPRSDYERALFEWTLSARIGQAIVVEHPGRILVVRYASLRSHPTETVDQVARWLGIESTPRHAALVLREADGSKLLPRGSRGSNWERTALHEWQRLACLA